MNVQYSTRERLYGLLMVSLMICGLFILAIIWGLLTTADNTLSDWIMGTFYIAILFLPINAVCLVIGMSTWWVGQRLGFSSYLAAFVSGSIALLVLMFSFSGFDPSEFASVWQYPDIVWPGIYTLFGGLCGITARFFAERARQKNIGGL